MAEEFTRLSTQASLPTRIRAPAHLSLAGLGISGGRWSAAKQELATAARLGQEDSALRADVATESGRTNEGLTLLDEVRGDIPFELLTLPYFSGEHARYLRSRLLFQTGRDEEALRLVENGFAGTPGELFYFAPAHLLQAEIQQRLGNKEAATEQYSRFIALWRSCDAPLRPVLEGARTQLARLVGEPR